VVGFFSRYRSRFKPDHFREKIDSFELSYKCR
jgi:hypothetical protein